MKERPETPVRGLARAARRRACLTSAGTPDVPFCAAAARATVVVLARRSVPFRGRQRQLCALGVQPAELGEPHAGHAVGSNSSNAARPIWRTLVSIGPGIVTGRVTRTSSTSLLLIHLCRAAVSVAGSRCGN